MNRERGEWLEGMLEGRDVTEPVSRAIAELYPAIGTEDVWIATAGEAIERLQLLEATTRILVIVPSSVP